MATVAKNTLLLGMVMAALVAAAACASAGIEPPSSPGKATFTIANPDRIVFSVLVSSKDVKVASQVTTIPLENEEQDIHITTADGLVAKLHVHDGDVVQLRSDPVDPRKFSAQVLSTTAFKSKPMLTPPKSSP